MCALVTARSGLLPVGAVVRLAGAWLCGVCHGPTLLLLPPALPSQPQVSAKDDVPKTTSHILSYRMVSSKNAQTGLGTGLLELEMSLGQTHGRLSSNHSIPIPLT